MTLQVQPLSTSTPPFPQDYMLVDYPTESACPSGYAAPIDRLKFWGACKYSLRVLVTRITKHRITSCTRNIPSSGYKIFRAYISYIYVVQLYVDTCLYILWASIIGTTSSGATRGAFTSMRICNKLEFCDLYLACSTQ